MKDHVITLNVCPGSVCQSYCLDLSSVSAVSECPPLPPVSVWDTFVKNTLNVYKSVYVPK